MHKLAVTLLMFCSLPGLAQRVAVLSSGNLDGPARHGLAVLEESLKAKGFSIEKGSGDFFVTAGLCPGAPQSLAIRRIQHQGKPALELCGADGTGLMYAALDAAGRIASRNPFSEIHDVKESPAVLERGVSMYTMQRAYFESRLYDENYWKRYFDMMARSRLNGLTIIFGYENGGFMAPLYSYFFDTPGFTGVRLVGITREQQEHNTAAFKALIRIAHERGVTVTAGIWDHIYRGGVQAGGIPGASENAGKEVPGLVFGVTTENLAPYTKAALRRFLEVFPEIDGLELRMHTESGLKSSEMAGFWHEVFGFFHQFKPDLRLTLRAKDLPDAIIEDALSQNLKVRIETKYWMEQVGMPFHPTHINRQDQKNRRHGYADLLRYPQKYSVLFRLWTGGATRLLLWDDPEYVRRFVASLGIYPGSSFDVNEPLAFKMLGEPHDRPPMPILNEKYKYYDYEFERYWFFYQLFGRLSYNPQTLPDLWTSEFQRRFGAAGVHLMNGLQLASQVVPRIVAAAYRYQMFPATRGWAEMMRQGDLPQFADLEGSDLEQFMSPRDDAKSIVAKAETSLRRPEETSLWFASISDGILRHVQAAEAAGASGNEARSTITDLKILAGLARYYARRLPAAVSYNLYLQTHDLAYFDSAIEREQQAVVAWEEMVKAAGDVYSEELAFGVHAVGFPRHWKEELGKLRQGVEKLEAQRGDAKPGAETQPLDQPWANTPPHVTLEPAGAARPGQDLRISVRAVDPVKSLRLRYRHLTQYEDYESVEMVQEGKSAVYTAVIPGRFITDQWDLIYFVEAIGRNGGRNYPDLDYGDPYVIVRVGTH